jgi:formylglycine-generating enzyme required for sulfatase activity
VGYWVALNPKKSLDDSIHVNSIGMEFVKIPAGESMMGSLSNESGRYDDESPVHKITIKKPFYLGKFEVTQKQWNKVMGSNHSSFMGENLPAENLSWNDVQKFVEKLNHMEGTDKYHLPSENEWEYACRAGTTTRYYFGDDEPKLEDYAWYINNSAGSTHAVGQKKPNPWSLYDMHGNVAEWCQDNYNHHNYSYNLNYSGASLDGGAWEDGSNIRIFRGGSWSDYARNCRSSNRNYHFSGLTCSSVGFRVLREI